ncbi:hypothetical protein FB107DRAFT_281002 [Schizophyllum commune]
MYTPAQMACINRHPDNLPFIFEGSPKDPRRVKHLHRYATLRVAVSRPIDDPSDDKDPLAFVDFERGASRARPLANIPGFIAEVGKGGPPRTRGEQQHDLPPFDFDTANVPEQVEPPTEQLPDFLYAGSNFEDYELIDSPVFRPFGHDGRVEFGHDGGVEFGHDGCVEFSHDGCVEFGYYNCVKLRRRVFVKLGTGLSNPKFSGCVVVAGIGVANHNNRGCGWAFECATWACCRADHADNPRSVTLGTLHVCVAEFEAPRPKDHPAPSCTYV